MCKICKGNHDTTNCPKLDFDEIIEVKRIVERAKERVVQEKKKLTPPQDSLVGRGLWKD